MSQPKNNQNRNFFLGLFLLAGLIYAGPILAQNSDPIGTRINDDNSQNQAEDAALATRQNEQDQQACTAEAGGSSTGSGGSTGNNGGTGNGGSGGSTGSGQQDEFNTRSALAEAGYAVNNQNACGGLTYAQYSQQNSGQRCTSVEGLPQHSIDQLADLHEAVGLNDNQYLTVTGGTEAGHATHGVGQNVVDLDDNNARLNTYIANQAVSSWQGSRGTYYQHSNGDVYLRESDHWHVNFSGSENSSDGQVAKSETTLWQQFKIAWWPTIAEAIQIPAASNDASQMLDNLSDMELNTMFNGLPAFNINNLVSQLPFDTLNNTFSRLDSSALNHTMSALTNSTFNNVSHLFTSESLDHVFDNLNRSSVSSVLNNLDANNLTAIFGNLDPSSVTGVFSQLTSGATDDLIGQLSQGALSNVFGGVNDNLIDNIVNNLGPDSLNHAFTLLGGSTLNGVLENLGGGAMESILPNLGQLGLNNIFGNGLPDAIGTALEGVAPELIESAVGALPTEIAQDLVANVPVVADALGVAGGALGGLGGLTGGLYVPVVEQNGQLMQHTATIDTTTQEVKDLSIKICTYLKQIARIQASFETGATEDATVMRTRATEIEKYRLALLDLIKNGYTDNQDNKKSGPLFVVNTRIYWQESALEGVNLARVAIDSSTNPDKNEILTALAQGNELSMTPTITAEQISLLRGQTAQNNNGQNLTRADNIPILSSLIIKPFKKTLAWLTGQNTLAQTSNPTGDNQNNDQAWWDAWLLLIQPRNNRYGSFLIATDLVNAKKNEAVAIARDEALAGQGFLPVRECVEWASENPKVCRVWQTQTPGSLIKDSGAAGLNSRLTQYEQAKKKGELVQGNEPNVTELITLTPATGGGGAPGPGMVSPGQIAENSQALRSDAGANGSGTSGDGNGNDNTGSGDTGEGTDDGGYNSWDNIMSFVDNIFRSNDTPEEGNNLLLQALIGLFSRQAPLIHFNSTNRENNEVLLYWFSPNGTCVAGNDWLNGDDPTPLKKAGASLGKSDKLRVTKPTSNSATYQITCTNDKGTLDKEVTVPASG